MGPKPNGCCCGTIPPHCPWCHSVATHGVTEFLYMVGGGIGTTVRHFYFFEAAVRYAQESRQFVAAAPIIVDYREAEGQEKDLTAAEFNRYVTASDGVTYGPFGHAGNLASVGGRQAAEEREDTVWKERLNLDPKSVALVRRTLAPVLEQIRRLFEHPANDPAEVARLEAVLQAVEELLHVDTGYFGEPAPTIAPDDTPTAVLEPLRGVSEGFPAGRRAAGPAGGWDSTRQTPGTQVINRGDWAANHPGHDYVRVGRLT